ASCALRALFSSRLTRPSRSIDASLCCFFGGRTCKCISVRSPLPPLILFREYRRAISDQTRCLSRQNKYTLAVKNPGRVTRYLGARSHSGLTIIEQRTAFLPPAA